MTHGDNQFYCANERDCRFHTTQPKTNVAQEVGEYKLCKDCVSRGFYLDTGVVVKKRTTPARLVTGG